MVQLTRRNLGKANEKRSYKIFEEFAYVLIEEARRSCYKEDFEIDIDGNIYAFDSTTIDLCLSVFWWAEFRKHKGGIKLHTLYDVKTSIPSFLHITTASVHDVNALNECIPIRSTKQPELFTIKLDGWKHIIPEKIIRRSCAGSNTTIKIETEFSFLSLITWI